MTTNLSITTETLVPCGLVGEALCDPKRLKWWRTDLVDEMSGGDFMRRLAPRTHRWAALEAAREAARLTDRRGLAGLPRRLHGLPPKDGSGLHAGL